MSIDHNVSEFCLATVVTPKSIESMLEADTGGLFKDQNLWRVAKTFFLRRRQLSYLFPYSLPCAMAKPRGFPIGP